MVVVRLLHVCAFAKYLHVMPATTISKWLFLMKITEGNEVHSVFLNVCVHVWFTRANFCPNR